MLFDKGDPGDALFVIRSGWVKLVSEDDDETSADHNLLIQEMIAELEEVLVMLNS